MNGDLGMPLSDVRVLDFGQAVAGPLCGTYLADLGADVVKVERPSGDVYRIQRRELDGESFNPAFELINRNKRSLCIDVKTDRGAAVVEDLVAESDVLIQNWPPGVAEKLGLDYDTLREHNDDLVYVHITGYGETGPAADKPAMDTIIQHVSGFSSLLGYDDHPPIRSQSSVADFYAGQNAAIATLAALRHRDAGNGGQKVDVSMLESLMHNIDGVFEYYNNLGEEPGRAGRNGFFTPDMLYGAAEAEDGWISVALILYSDRVWRGFCELVDREDLLVDDRYEDDEERLEDAARFTELFEEWLGDRTVEEALGLLDEHGIPAAEHNTVPEAANMPQVEHRGVFTEVDHPRLGELTLTSPPMNLSESQPEIRTSAPVLGADNAAVLRSLGLSESEVEELEAEGIVDSR